MHSLYIFFRHWLSRMQVDIWAALSAWLPSSPFLLGQRPSINTVSESLCCLHTAFLSFNINRANILLGYCNITLNGVIIFSESAAERKLQEWQIQTMKKSMYTVSQKKTFTVTILANVYSVHCWNHNDCWVLIYYLVFYLLLFFKFYTIMFFLSLVVSVCSLYCILLSRRSRRCCPSACLFVCLSVAKNAKKRDFLKK